MNLLLSTIIELPPVTTRTTTTPQPDWRKHGKHGNDGNTIKHSKG